MGEGGLRLASAHAVAGGCRRPLAPCASEALRSLIPGALGCYPPAVPRADLVTVGEAFEDLIFLGLPRLPRLGEEVKTSAFVRTIGGGAVITAVAAARLGLRCRVLSGLSASAASLLRRERVAVRNLRRVSEPHAITAALSTRDDRGFVTFNGVNDSLEPRLRGALRGETPRHVHFAFFPPECGRWERIVARLRRRGISTSWDFGWNESLLKDPRFLRLVGALDYVFLNEQECVLYARCSTTNTAIEHWRTRAREAVIKLGPKGSRWVSSSRDLRAPAYRVKVVDTTGAGDAFNGGFLYALLKGMGPRECLRVGNFVGAMSTRSAGGVASLPRRRDLP